MSLLSRFNIPEGPELHSNAIAKADDSQAQTMGSSDASTFEQRKSIEHSRKIITAYQAAGVVGTYKQAAKLEKPAAPAPPTEPPIHRHRTYVERRQLASQPIIRPGITPPARSATPTTKPATPTRPLGTSYSEPKSRGYNPFA